MAYGATEILLAAWAFLAPVPLFWLLLRPRSHHRSPDSESRLVLPLFGAFVLAATGFAAVALGAVWWLPLAGMAAGAAVAGLLWLAAPRGREPEEETQPPQEPPRPRRPERPRRRR